jgi:pyruvate/oxaloacetate carboxyltransferase
MQQEEDVLSYALFPQVATKFFENRKKAAEGPKEEPVAAPIPSAAQETPIAPDGVRMLYVEDLSIS